MTKQKSNMRSLLLSALSLLMCISMFVGSTFAWFTDSVVSGNNVIKSGNLDIEVQYTLDGETWNDFAGAKDLFQKGLWEPGHTEVVALRIKNNGSLALKYVANMNIVEETTGKTKDGADIVLSDILKVSTLIQQAIEADGSSNIVGDISLALAFSGEDKVAYEHTAAFKESNVLRADRELHPGVAHYLIVKVDMPETVGNEANHNGTNVPSITFGMNVLATQYTYESDSFDSQYDKDSQYGIVIPADAVKVTSLAELESGLAIGGNYNITAPITVNKDLTIAEDTKLYGENAVLTITDNYKFTVNADKSLEVYGVTFDAQGEFSFNADGNIVYDADARRTTPLINAGAGSSLKLGEGTVVQNVVAKGSAVISTTGTADNRATVVLEGATIKNCAGESGTIINVNKASDVVIEAGTVISGNASYNNNNHGIIRVYNAWDAANPSTVTMNGGEINGNYYSGNGMIGLYYGKFILNGGEINNNSWFEDNQKSNGWYPVIYAHSNSQFVMNGGEICGNTVKSGVINSLNSGLAGALTINGGKVSGNLATNHGNKDAFAAVYSKALNSLVVSEDAECTGTVFVYADENGSYIGKYYEQSEYFGN